MSPHFNQNGYHEEHNQEVLVKMQWGGGVIHCWWE
jgi:hypothetical protein